MNIFQTFELFLRKPLSILKHGLISIVHLRTEGRFNPTSITADLLENKAQITVVNNEKVYNLLKMVTYRAHKKQEAQEVLEKQDTEPLKTATLFEYAEDKKG